MIKFLFLIIYFTPTLNAAFKRHSAFIKIFLLNLFFGWTLIGWVIAFIWSNLFFSNSKAAKQ